MLYYKDKKFCLAKKCSRWATCERAATEETVAAAEKAGMRMMVAAAFRCYIPKEGDDDLD